MAAVMLQMIPSFCANFSAKSLFVSANTYEKYMVCRVYCIAHHYDKLYFLTYFRSRNILIGHIDELLRKMDAD